LLLILSYRTVYSSIQPIWWYTGIASFTHYYILSFCVWHSSRIGIKLIPVFLGCQTHPKKLIHISHSQSLMKDSLKSSELKILLRNWIDSILYIREEDNHKVDKYIDLLKSLSLTISRPSISVWRNLLLWYLENNLFSSIKVF
jgi:hypothetical protein